MFSFIHGAHHESSAQLKLQVVSVIVALLYIRQRRLLHFNESVVMPFWHAVQQNGHISGCLLLIETANGAESGSLLVSSSSSDACVPMGSH